MTSRYTPTRPHGYTATRLDGYTATRLHGYTATGRSLCLASAIGFLSLHGCSVDVGAGATVSFLEEAFIDLRYEDDGLLDELTYHEGPPLELVTLPDGSIEVLSILENPPIVGMVDTINIGVGPTFLGSAGPGIDYLETQEYGQFETRWVGAFSDSSLTARADVFWDADAGERKWSAGLWLTDDDPLTSFVAPPISLPPDHSPVFLTAMRRGGNLDEDPWSSIGLARVRLRDNVIVIPVHLRIFYGAGGMTIPRPLDSFIRWIDEGVELSDRLGKRSHFSSSLSFDAIAGHYVATMDLGASVPERFQFTDVTWAQCGIQFRLASIQLLQDPELAQTGFAPSMCDPFTGATDPAGRTPFNVPSSPLSMHHRLVEDVAANPGFYVYLTGRIWSCDAANWLTAGLASKPPCGTASVNARSFVMLSETRLRRDRGVLAHEFGHLLSLGHTFSRRSEASCDPALDMPPPPDDLRLNLMNSNGSAVESALLSPLQCVAARASAQAYLDRWGL